MDYQGNIFRPPSEANSILLQVTTGCSHNKCSFCGMYKGTRFSIKNDEIIDADIEYAKKHFRNFDRLFLCDGDALIVPQKRLRRILEKIKTDLPWIKRIGTYANAKSIKRKTPEDLVELRRLGLGIAYVGLESGDDETLRRINKGTNAASIIEMGRKIRQAGIKLSITVLLGIAQAERSMIHAEETGRVLSALDPDFVGALSFMVTPGTDIHAAWQKGTWHLLGPLELLKELRVMLAHTEMSDGLFHANHASNYLPIRAHLPFDKQAVLKRIDRALAGQINLKPEYLRAL